VSISLVVSMKSSAILTLGSAAMATAFQQCSGSAKNEGGNWFCGAVDHILYSNVGHPGTYKAVSHMGSDGSCKYESKEFSGPLAPYNEEVCHSDSTSLPKRYCD
jgi:Tos1-like cell wall protein